MGVSLLLYKKDRLLIILCSERLLAMDERPADIVRRRLEQTGYDVTDGWRLLSESGLSFLLRFTFKSAYAPVSLSLLLFSTIFTQRFLHYSKRK